MKLALVAIHGYKRFHFIFLSPFCLWYIQIDISYYFYYDSKDPSLKSWVIMAFYVLYFPKGMVSGYDSAILFPPYADAIAQGSRA